MGAPQYLLKLTIPPPTKIISDLNQHSQIACNMSHIRSIFSDFEEIDCLSFI